MNILHIYLGISLYAKSTAKYLAGQETEHQHDFLIYEVNDEKRNQLSEEMQKYGGTRCYLRNTLKTFFSDIITLQKRYDIIAHHFFPENPSINLFYYIHKKISQKLVWVIWGADLYSYKVKSKWKKTVLRRARTRIKYVIGNEIDQQKYIEEFGNSNKFFCSEVEFTGYTTQTIDDNYFDRTSTDSYKVLVGHSANPALNHLEVLKILSRFKEKNIKLLIPLNYGNKEYAKSVEKEARKQFREEQIEILLEPVPIEKYIQLLWSCDAAFFHTERQIGLGNIKILLYMNKKIYLKKGSVMKKYFDQKGLTTFQTDEVISQDYEEFKLPLQNSSNRAYAQKALNTERLLKGWTQIFNEIHSSMKSEH